MSNAPLAEIQADLVVLRLVLKTMLANALMNQPEIAEEALHSIQVQVKKLLAGQKVDSGSQQGDERAKAIIQHRADGFFEEIALALSDARKRTGESGRH